MDIILRTLNESNETVFLLTKKEKEKVLDTRRLDSTYLKPKNKPN